MGIRGQAVDQAADFISPDMVEQERTALARHAKLNFVHWLVVFLSVVLTMAAWQYSKLQIDLKSQARFDFAADQTAELVRERLQKYELALWAGVSALKTHGNDIDLNGWHTFAENLEIEHRYPGINGIGVIHQVVPENLEAYLARQRSARPEFSIHPAHGRDIYQPITYIEPVGINAKAVGLDMVHEVNRHTSFNKARDTGTAQITGPVILVQDQSRTPGFLFFAPFYEGENHQTVAERQASFSGAVYAPFVVNKLMKGVLDKDRRSIAIRISDADQVIYDEIHSDDPDYDPKPLGEKRIHMDFYGRDWIVDVRAGLGFRAANSAFEPTAILLAGILIDLALLGLFILLARANRRGLRFADMATDALSAESRALMTANEELEVAREKADGVSEMKSIFLSTMSHEVRTPLTAISGILVLLDRAKLPEQQNNLVQAGKMASEKLMKLLTDVLDVSRLEANAVELWERDVAVAPLVEDWRALAEGMIERLGKDIVITTQIATDMPERIVVDDIRLAQVMNNLIDNAIRFTERGSISIRVFRKDGQPGQPPLCGLSVTDTGVGIAKDNLQLIFERFRQVDGSMTREQGGSGLGLAICQDLVALLCGEINVSSALGVGTEFEVILPVHGARSKGLAPIDKDEEDRWSALPDQ